MSNTREFVFMWEIHNFSCDFYKCGDSIDSPIFEASNFGGSQWCLRLYPFVEDNSCKEMIAVYLYKKKNNIYAEDSSLSYEIELIGDKDNGKSLGKVKSAISIYKLNERFGWNNFLYSSTVSNGLKNWPGNVLIVRCHMFRDSTQRCSPDFEVRTEIPVNRISFLWNIKISDISSKLVHKDLVFTEKSVYEMTLSMPEDVCKICVSQKEESTFPSFVECKLSLVKSNGNVLKLQRFTHLFETNDKSDVWNFSSFITKAELNGYSDCWGKNTFSLFCEIAVTNGTKPVITSSGYGKKIIEGNDTVLQDLKNMLCNRIHSDIKLKVENEELHAHKAILASRSPVFSAMFDQDMVESQTGVINIPNFDADIMKLFLEFLYTDTVDNFNYEKAKKLFVVADKYQVSSLAEKCATFLESILSLENATEILSLVDMIGHERLKKAAMNFIAINLAIIFNTLGWKNLIQENVKLVGEVVSNIASNFKIVPNN